MILVTHVKALPTEVLKENILMKSRALNKNQLFTTCITGNTTIHMVYALLCFSRNTPKMLFKRHADIFYLLL